MSSLVMAWGLNAKATSNAKIVLLNLADASDKFGRVRFTLASLAHDCHYSLVETRALLRQLIDEKLIMLEPSDMPLREIDSWQQALLLINRNSREVASYVKN